MSACRWRSGLSVVLWVAALGHVAAWAQTGPWESPPPLPAPTGNVVWVSAGDAADLQQKCRALVSGRTLMVSAGADAAAA